MKNRMIKVGTVVPRMKVANVTYNTAQIIQTMNENADAGFLVYPELCLTDILVAIFLDSFHC